MHDSKYKKNQGKYNYTNLKPKLQKTQSFVLSLAILIDTPIKIYLVVTNIQ